MRLVTTDYKVLQTNKVIEEIHDANFYVFAGKILPFDNDQTPPSPNNSVRQSYYLANEDMIFAKRVTSDDVYPMIRRIDWESEKVYDIYDDSDPNLHEKDFYVVSQEGPVYSVFKCLSNNDGQPSIQRPLLSQTSASDELYQTTDGYIWKYIYSVDDFIFNRFSTSDFMPYEPDSDVENEAIEGTVDNMIIIDGGVGYNVYTRGIVEQINVQGDSQRFFIQGLDGVLSSNTNYYTDSGIYMTTGTAQGQFRKIVDYGSEQNNRFVQIEEDFSPMPSTTDEFEIAPHITIDGDGEDFVAKGSIDFDTNSINNIDIINPGRGYSFGNVVVSSNTNTVSGITSSPADIRFVTSPQGGHGAYGQTELFGYFLGISVDFISNLLPSANNEFRSFGIINNVKFPYANLVLNDVENLEVGDEIEQYERFAKGEITSIDTLTGEVELKDVEGVFEVENTLTSGETIDSVPFDFLNIDQRLKLDVNLVFESGFQRGERVYQEETNAEGYVHEYNSGMLYLVNVRGQFKDEVGKAIIGDESSTRANINSIKQPGIDKKESKILYRENIQPVKRSNDQTERIKIVLGF